MVYLSMPAPERYSVAMRMLTKLRSIDPSHENAVRDMRLS